MVMKYGPYFNVSYFVWHLSYADSGWPALPRNLSCLGGLSSIAYFQNAMATNGKYLIFGNIRGTYRILGKNMW